MPSALREGSHRRLNPLTGEWALVSPHRMQRPWQGRREPTATPASLAHDPNCYLCAGNLRANGARNPDYPHTFVFDNDFPALKRDAPTEREDDGLLVAEGELGICRVLCFSPRHDLTLSGMPVADIERVIDAWVEETIALGGLPDIASVQIFENRGEMMGARIPTRTAKSGRLAICRTSWTRKRGGRTIISSKPDGRCSSTIWSAS